MASRDLTLGVKRTPRLLACDGEGSGVGESTAIEGMMVLVEEEEGNGSAYVGEVDAGNAAGADAEGDRVMKDGVEELASWRRGEGVALYGVYLSGRAEFGTAWPLVQDFGDDVDRALTWNVDGRNRGRERRD